ncbi:hypothetical protein NT239_13885 [Chitinibacter sp. SCUT-21]|uniref:hypothetical protein n=1 Tax=Chitinibacter sp. SCUT-21 TaxID=2970891 RepID=UPI0035A5E1AF
MRSEWVSLGPKKQKHSSGMVWIVRVGSILLSYALFKALAEYDDWFLSSCTVATYLIFAYAFGLNHEIKFNCVRRVIATSSTWFGLPLKKQTEVEIKDFLYVYLSRHGSESEFWQVKLFSIKHAETGVSVAFSDKDVGLAEAERLAQLFGLPNRGFVTFKGGFSQ